jgi:hypothetical protein
VADIVLEGAFLQERAEPQEVGADPETPDPVPLSQEELASLDGFYLREDYDVPVSIRARDGVLVAGGQRLIHEGDWVFRVGDGGDTTRFWTDSEGQLLSIGPDGKQYRRLPRIEPEAVELEEYVGHYWSDDLGVEYEVRVEEDHLAFWNRKIGSRALNPIFPDGFSTGQGVIFSRNSQGEIDGFTISSGRVWKVRFRRLEGRYPG